LNGSVPDLIGSVAHCRCSKPMHGPYGYLFTKTGGKTKSKYIGKDKPAGA